jgi:hypothetical protein
MVIKMAKKSEQKQQTTTVLSDLQVFLNRLNSQHMNAVPNTAAKPELDDQPQIIIERINDRQAERSAQHVYQISSTVSINNEAQALSAQKKLEFKITKGSITNPEGLSNIELGEIKNTLGPQLYTTLCTRMNKVFNETNNSDPEAGFKKFLTAQQYNFSHQAQQPHFSAAWFIAEGITKALKINDNEKKTAKTHEIFNQLKTHWSQSGRQNDAFTVSMTPEFLEHLLSCDDNALRKGLDYNNGIRWLDHLQQYQAIGGQGSVVMRATNTRLHTILKTELLASDRLGNYDTMELLALAISTHPDLQNELLASVLYMGGADGVGYANYRESMQFNDTLIQQVVTKIPVLGSNANTKTTSGIQQVEEHPAIPNTEAPPVADKGEFSAVKELLMQSADAKQDSKLAIKTLLATDQAFQTALVSLHKELGKIKDVTQTRLALKKFNASNNSAVEPQGIDFELLAQILVHMGVRNNKPLNSSQMYAIISALQDGHTLQELATGQGKTLIFQCSALYHALYAKKYHVERPVLILTHQADLAHEAGREMLEIVKDIGVSVSGYNDNTLNKYNADIVYNEVTDFALSVAQARRFKETDNDNKASQDFITFFNKMQHKGAILADEVDTFFDIDSATTLRYASAQNLEQKELYNHISIINKALDDYISEKNIKNLPLSAAQLKEMITALIVKYTVINALSELGFKDSETRKQILKGAHQAKVFSLSGKDSDFVIVDDNTKIFSNTVTKEQSYTKKINIVAKNTTGVEDKQSKWSDGVHQFLTVRMCDRDYSGQRDAMPVPGFSSVLVQTNIEQSLKSCNAKYIQGQTATPGKEAKQKAVAECSGIKPGECKFKKVPRAQKSNKLDIHPNVVEDQNEKFKAIAQQIIYRYCAHKNGINNTTSIVEGNNTLIIMEDIKECKKLFAYLKAVLPEEILEEVKQFHGVENKKDATVIPNADAAIAFLDQKEGPKVLISTNVAGRGFNFTKNLKNVIVGFLGHDEAMQQVQGRTGRQDNYGVTSIIVTKDV